MTSIDVEFPPVPQLSPADEIQVRRRSAAIVCLQRGF